MGGILEVLSNMARAVASIFGFAQQRDAEKNAPDVKAAKISQNEINAADKTKSAIGKQDVKETRNELAE